MHRKTTLSALALLAAAALALPAAAAAESWKNVSLVDQNCEKKVRDNPDAHTRACALQCAKSGYGILTAEGSYLKLDEAGSQKALAALQASDRKDHLRVDVAGEREGDSVKVASIALAN